MPRREMNNAAQKNLTPDIDQHTSEVMAEIYSEEDYEEMKCNDAFYQDGQHTAYLETARRMLAEGFDLPTTVRISGLSEEEIKALQQKMDN